jgi:hypothetical protein
LIVSELVFPPFEFRLPNRRTASLSLSLSLSLSPSLAACLSLWRTLPHSRHKHSTAVCAELGATRHLLLRRFARCDGRVARCWRLAAEGIVCVVCLVHFVYASVCACVLCVCSCNNLTCVCLSSFCLVRFVNKSETRPDPLWSCEDSTPSFFLLSLSFCYLRSVRFVLALFSH